jgi:hypothetical protein
VVNAAEMRRQALDEMKIFKELFPTEPKNNDTNVLILKMMEMVQNINEKQTAAQRDSEKRMYEALEKMNSKQGNSKQEFMEMFELFNSFQNNFSGGEQSAIEKFLPMIAPAIPGIVGQLTAPAVPAPIAIPAPVPARSAPTEEEIIENLISKIPADVKEKLTRENFNTAVETALTRNSHLSRDIIEKVFNKILDSKGV